MTFDEIYNAQHKKLLNFCIRRLGNVHDAEDITQRAFTDLFRTWGRYEFKDGGFPLLCQMARFRISNLYRASLSRIQCVPIAIDAPYEPGPPVVLGSQVIKAVWNLPRQQRRSVMMYYVGDMTFEEIAKEMGTGVTTAEYRTKAGIKKLRRVFT